MCGAWEHIFTFNCTPQALWKKSKPAFQRLSFLLPSASPAQNSIHTPGPSLVFQLRFRTARGNTNCPASKICPANHREPSASTESSIFPLQQLGTQSGKVFLYHPEHYIMKCWGNHLAWIETKFSTGENIVSEASGDALAAQCRSSQRWGRVSCIPLWMMRGAVLEELKLLQACWIAWNCGTTAKEVAPQFAG